YQPFPSLRPSELVGTTTRRFCVIPVMLLKPNYDVEESFKKTKPAYVGFFIAHSGHPFPPP
ncbi:hypothetical protein, partial [Escherichia coli]|uniref:hypothetical protein n=1 Tax=Escherichia coli TaxID=562 RepID=UPI001BC844F2